MDHRGIGEWVIGRHAAADLTIAIQSISKRHCCVNYSYAADRWFVTDLGSKNGTRVNGGLISPDDPHPLKIGDKLHLGPNPIHLVENEHSTEDMGVSQPTVAGLAPLDYRTGEPMVSAENQTVPPAVTPSPPADNPSPSSPKTLGDTLYLGASWLISPSTALGMVYRLVVAAVVGTVVVLVMGAI